MKGNGVDQHKHQDQPGDIDAKAGRAYLNDPSEIGELLRKKGSKPKKGIASQTKPG